MHHIVGRARGSARVELDQLHAHGCHQNVTEPQATGNFNEVAIGPAGSRAKVRVS